MAVRTLNAFVIIKWYIMLGKYNSIRSYNFYAISAI